MKSQLYWTACSLSLVLWSCGGPTTSVSNRDQDSQAAPATQEAQAASKAADEAIKAANAALGIPSEQSLGVKSEAHWEYSSEVDKMTDKASRTACVTSENELILGFPYEPTKLQLCLRDHPQHGHDVFVSMLGRGQFLYRSYESGRVKVRFGKGAPQTFPAIGPSDSSTETFFIRNRDRFEKALRSADTVTIQPEVYQAGVQAISFNTKGFAWPRVRSATE